MDTIKVFPQSSTKNPNDYYGRNANSPKAEAKDTGDNTTIDYIKCKPDEEEPMNRVETTTTNQSAAASSSSTTSMITNPTPTTSLTTIIDIDQTMPKMPENPEKTTTVAVNADNFQSNDAFGHFDRLLQLIAVEKAMIRANANAKRSLRLCGGGGGENPGSGSGWGSPPTGSGVVPNPNVVGSWGANPNQQQQQQPPLQQQVQQPPSQQPGGPGIVPPNIVQVPGIANPPLSQQPPQQPGQPQINPQQPPNQQAIVPGSATKNQLEQLNTMREALFSQDGWGCQHVNQDSNWEVPGSPDSSILKNDAGAWKTNINNGTELWEHNLRNGGQPPAPPVQKTPWGHTPSTNLGGTWGEDDDAADGNVWTGTPTNPAAPQWSGAGGAGGPGPAAQTPTTPGPGSAGGMWPGGNQVVKKENDWGAGAGAPAANNWGNTPLGGEQREMRAPSADPRLIDPRDQMRGDPRGISGRLNGSTEMWGQQHHGLPQHGQIPINKMVAPGPNGGSASQWGGATLPKDIPLSKPSGWEEPSPPAQRRPFDDGTSLWNQRQPPQQPTRVPGGNQGGGGQWKEAPDAMNRSNLMRNANVVAGPTPPIAQSRGALGLKPDTWGPNAGRNGSTWEDGGGHAMNWEDKMNPGGAQVGQWGEGGAGGGVGGGGGGAWVKKQASGQMWPEGGDITDWAGGHGGPKEPPQKMPTGGNSDLFRTEQYRVLLQMGFKKDDIELALRVNNLNIEDALEMLKQRPTGMDAWGRHDEHSGNFEQFPGGGRFPGGPQPPTMPFPPNNNPANILGGAGSGGVNPNLSNIGNIQPQVQKYLNQGQQGGFKQPPPPTSANQGGASGPSTLRMLVQQIQMAVQAGYLNHQILNQPLAPQTLVLLNQLLNNIKQLQMIQPNINVAVRGGNMNGLQAVTKIKQQISNLQNQITAQQAIYMKQQQQQQQQQQNTPHVDFLRNHQDPIVPLQGNFSEMSMNKDQQPSFQGSSQQSRLNQWKLPNSLSNDESGNDFSKSGISSSMGGLGLQGDGTWSSGRNIGDGWPDANSEVENKDWPSTSQPSPSAAFSDVPEFEPGKPWKGTQMKNIEDDPSITPGSVGRSPLSISAAKESDLFGGISSKTSPNDLSLNLSSSTWSFNNKLNNPPTTTGTSELWGGSGGSMSKGARGPPPGLGGNGANTAPVANGWGATGGSTAPLTRSISASGNSNTWSGNANSWGHSTWLLLKNLTTQIDGSTLRTLCQQHGPLLNFLLYLNHNIALCKYNTREEAQKAQTALNNCVLGNTTICAESPSENEVQNILLHLGAPAAVAGTPVSSGQAPSWRPAQQQGTVAARNSGNAAWPSSTAANNLWAPLEGGGGNAASERGTPSNLNSYLPENLLGGELN